MIYPNYQNRLTAVINKMGDDFPNLNWNFRPVPTGSRTELISQWLGDPSEDIMAVCCKTDHYMEQFHKQDFFFINFICQNSCDVLSSKYDNQLHLEEGDCYIGQPYSGYAIRVDGSEEVIIAGILVRKDVFYREFLSPLSADTTLFHFFLDPHTNQFSDEYIRMHLDPDDVIWAQLYQMMLEYAGKGENSQMMLHSMMLTMTMYLSRAYRAERRPDGAEASLALQMASYIEAYSDTVTLRKLAEHFGYHPNYVSRYLRQETGQTFSEIVLEKRMQKAELLLLNTALTIEKIAAMLGYSNNSNFYKAFRTYYKTSPREFAAGRKMNSR